MKKLVWLFTILVVLGSLALPASTDAQTPAKLMRYADISDDQISAVFELLPIGVLAEDLLDSLTIGDAIDSDVDNGRTRLDEVGSDHCVATDGDDENVCTARHSGEVSGA